MKKILLILIIAIALVLAITLGKKETPQPLTSEENVVVITDQKTDTEENTITVGYAKLAKPGFVVVSTKNSETGEMMVLGASTLLPAGEHFNVKVKRTGQILSSGKAEVVTASLVADNGDGEYSETDEMLSSETSTEVMIALDIEEDGELSIEEVANQLEDAGYSVNEDADVLVDMSDDETETSEEMTGDSSMEVEEGAQQESPDTGEVQMEVSEETEL